MKRIYAFALSLIAVALSTLSAAAGVSAGFVWELPGSVVLRLEGFNNEPVDLPSDATSYSYSTSAGYGYVYVGAAEGFVLEKVVCEETGKEYFPQSYSANSASININSSTSGSTFKVVTFKPDRSSEFTIDVKNGADAISAIFTSSAYTLSLADGKNVVNYDPAVDTNLEFTISTADKNTGAYLFETTNEFTEDINKYAARATYTVPAVAPGSEFTIQVTEKAPEQCTVTIELPEGFAECLTSVRNWTTDRFVDVVDNTVTVNKGADVAFNFDVASGDYVYTAFYVNGEQVSANASGIVRFIVNENTTLRVEGSLKQWGDTPFTAYIMNPEGVNLRLMYFEDGELAELTGGTQATGDIEIDGYTLLAADTWIFRLSVSEKRPMVFVEAKDGYFINTVVGNDGEGNGELQSINVSNLFRSQFYVMALPVESNEYSFNLDVHAVPSNVTLGTSNPHAGMWGNPGFNFTPVEGEQTVEFIDGLFNPFSLRAYSASQTSTVRAFIDGKEATADENGAFVIDPYVPADAEALQAKSDVAIFSDGNNPSLTGVTFTLIDGAQATLYGSDVRWKAAVGDNAVLSGTTFTLVPADPDQIITYKDVVVNGYDESTQQTIDGLNENGEYVFTPSGNARNNVLTVAPASPLGITDATVLPAETSFTVVAPDGRVLLDGADAQAVKTLPRGIYIINGKKAFLSGK